MSLLEAIFEKFSKQKLFGLSDLVVLMKFKRWESPGGAKKVVNKILLGQLIFPPELNSILSSKRFLSHILDLDCFSVSERITIVAKSVSRILVLVPQSYPKLFNLKFELMLSCESSSVIACPLFE